MEGLQWVVVGGSNRQWWDEGGEPFLAPRNFFSSCAERR